MITATTPFASPYFMNPAVSGGGDKPSPPPNNEKPKELDSE